MNTELCQHDPIYLEMNEAAGGIGCPLCNRARIAALRQRNADAPRPADRIVSAAVTLDELSDSIIADMEAKTTQLIDATRHIWNETQAEAY
jgi:hypothetical protein